MGAAIASSGAVTPLPGSPFDEGMGIPSITQITTDPQSRFIYVLNVPSFASGSMIAPPGIGAFAVDSTTGALTRVPGSPIVFSDRNDNMLATDGSGHFLFEGNLANTGFDVYSIDQASGNLTKTPWGSNAPPVGTFALASPDGRWLFNAGNGMVEVFSIASTGNLTAVSGAPLSTGGSAGPMAITADSKFLYIANQTEGTVMVFSVGNDGSLAALSGAPFNIEPKAQSIVLSPDGKFLYAAIGGGLGMVEGYLVDPTTGVFSAIPGAVVNGASTISIDSSGRLAYLTVDPSATQGMQLFIYAIDPITGALTQLSMLPGAPLSDDSLDMVTVP